MGEVYCASQGDIQKWTQWVNGKPDRFLIWAGEAGTSHPRIYEAQDNELKLQQIASELVYLPFVYDNPSHPILQKLARIQTEIHYRSSDFMDQGKKLLNNFRSNLQKPFALASELYGQFNQYSAIVCGAGPSLEAMIPFLKENRDRFLIVGCGAGMQALLAAGITPHLAVHVDPDPYHKFPKTNIPLFYQLRTSPEVVNGMTGPRFLMAGSGEFPLERYLEEKLGETHQRDGGWTAVTRGAVLCQDLGCSRIYFAGVDFSSVSGSVYAKGVASNTTEIRSDWLLAAEWLNTWVETHPEIRCGICLKPNPLMPAIPVLELIGGETISPIIPRKEVLGKQIWDAIAGNFTVCHTLFDQFMSHFQTIFPRSPLQDLECVDILSKIDEQLVVQKILDPIWSHWEVVLKREPNTGPEALAIHRVLLLKTLADEYHV